MTRSTFFGLFILVVSCAKRDYEEIKISNEEKNVLFTVKDLINHGYEYDQPSNGSEKFEKVIFENGYKLTYNYQTPDSAASRFIRISSSLLAFDNKTDAVAGYYGILAGSTFKVLISDKIEQREKADTKIEGDNSKILEFRARESQVVVAYGWVNQVDNILYVTYFITPNIEKIDVWTSILPYKLRQARNL